MLYFRTTITYSLQSFHRVAIIIIIVIIIIIIKKKKRKKKWAVWVLFCFVLFFPKQG